MSELTNFLKKKYKTQAAFDKAFGGDGRAAMKLLEAMGEASPAVNKEAQKIFRANPDDIEKGVAAIRRRVYGDPDAKTGVRGKKPPVTERIEGNLPTNDKGVVADPPKSKGKRGPKKEEVVEDAGDDEMSTSIGQFVPAPDLSGVNVAGSFLPGAFDPRVQVEIGGAAPTFSVDTDPASLRRANPFDVGRLSDPRFAAPDVEPSVASDAPPASMPVTGAPSRADRIMAGLLDDAPQADAAPAPSRADLLMAGLLDDAPTEGSPFGPYRDGLFDMNSGTDVEPPANPSLPGTVSPDGGFLGQDAGPPYLGVAPTPDSPTLIPQPAAADELGNPRANPWSKLVDDAVARGQTESALAGAKPGPMSRSAQDARPPLDKRGIKEFLLGPGALSRGNEFLYQRGILPKPVAEVFAPAARVIDPLARVGLTGLAIAGAARGIGNAVGGAMNYMNSDAVDAPPSDEEQAALEERADRSMRELQQIIGGNARKNPASAQPSTPVQ